MVEKIGDVGLKLTCPKCGKEVPLRNDANDTDMVSCPSCGAEVATAGDIRKAGKKVVGKMAKDAIREGLKRR